MRRTQRDKPPNWTDVPGLECVMKLVELVIDILDHSETPLKQGEILSIAEQREDYAQCRELQEVKVPLSAVARCLTKYSSGSNPVFGVAFEGKNKQSQKRFFLKTKDIPEVKLTR